MRSRNLRLQIFRCYKIYDRWCLPHLDDLTSLVSMFCSRFLPFVWVGVVLHASQVLLAWFSPLCWACVACIDLYGACCTFCGLVFVTAASAFEILTSTWLLFLSVQILSFVGKLQQGGLGSNVSSEILCVKTTHLGFLSLYFLASHTSGQSWSLGDWHPHYWRMVIHLVKARHWLFQKKS